MSTPLDDAVVASKATRRSHRSGAPRMRLRGRRLILARAVWVTVVTLIVALFLARLPAYYTALQTLCTGATCGPVQSTPDSALALQRLGLSVGAYAVFTLALTIALAFLCFTLGAVIFWRRSDDWMALLGALAVVASVTLNPGVYGMDMTSAWGWLAMVMLVFGNGVYLLLLSLSDGRFVTRWVPWLFLCWAVAVCVFFIFMYGGLQHLDGRAGNCLRSQRVRAPIPFKRPHIHPRKPTGDCRFHLSDWGGCSNPCMIARAR
jgi:hypothetical protein